MAFWDDFPWQMRMAKVDMSGSGELTCKVGVAKTVFLANGHFAGVTPAIFVIFVDFRGPRSKIPCFCGRNAISEFSPIFVKTTCFRQGTKRPFFKTTVSTTLIKDLIWEILSRRNIFVECHLFCLDCNHYHSHSLGITSVCVYISYSHSF